MARIDGAQHVANLVLQNLATAIGNGLIEQRQRITHTARGGLADQVERAALKVDLLGLQYLGQVRGNGFAAHIAQIELHAARQHRDRHFLRIGRGKNEKYMRRRFFKRLEHRVERVRRQHVHLVDHVDLVATGRGRVNRVVEQLRHFVNAAIRRSIKLEVIDKTALIDFGTGTALTTGRGRHAGLAVHRLGQNARDRRLTHTASAGKQIGVMNTTRLECVVESADDMILPHQRIEGAGSPFTCQNLMRHKSLGMGMRSPPDTASTGADRPTARRSDAACSELLGGRAWSPALVRLDGGCFLPDLTNYDRQQCEGARPFEFYQSAHIM